MILKRYQSLRVISFHMCMVKGKVELVFPTDIPFDAVKSMFNMKEKSTDKPKHFNRILLDPSRSKDQEIKINFVSDGDNFKIYEAKLSGVYLKRYCKCPKSIYSISKALF